jgi:hypothetical protein
MSAAFVVVHIADDGALTVFGNAYGSTLDQYEADAVAQRLVRLLGGAAHVRQLVPF